MKKANNINNPAGGQGKAESNEAGKGPSASRLEFTLVLCMLIALTILVTLLILLPILVKEAGDTDFIDYSKWVLTALLAAFGAWIGAGAAYFFGKENLRLSSESTQEALKLQQDSAKARSESALIKDINLTPLNPDFKFTFDTEVKEVLKKLGENVDYWFVPVVEKEKLKDTIHTEAFWRYDKDEYEAKLKKTGEPKVKDVVDYIENTKKLEQKKKKLHGFFVEVEMSASVSEVSDMMNKQAASVGIVCDQDSKPTHCFSRKDLRSFQLGSS